jgi:hypothetical protein
MSKNFGFAPFEVPKNELKKAAAKGGIQCQSDGYLSQTLIQFRTSTPAPEESLK